MKTSTYLILFLVALSGFYAQAADKPNIIVILADDFGVGDIQAHYPDNKIATPHLDQLVRQGMSFTDAHSPSAVCSPTRYGLLTGRYAWRTRLQEWVIAAYEPPLISEGRPTLPGFLREHGYETACIGKWHIGWDWQGPQKAKMTKKPNGQKNLTWDFTKSIPGGPVDRGFDYFYGLDLPNLPPFTWIENDRVTILPTAKLEVDESEGIVLPTHSNGTAAAPNWKLRDVLPEITNRAADYVRQNAKSAKPFFLFFSQTSPHEPVVPSESFRGKSGIAPIADFVMETDWSAGEVIRAVDESGIADNTIVIFTADNGHSHYTGWQDLIDAGHLPSGPYRGHKGDVWEGGHRVPLVVRWPEKIKAGSSSDQLVCLTDFFATFADIVGQQLPVDGAEDSLSFLPDLLGDGESERTNVVSHSRNGEFSYREGNWKLVYRMSEANLEKSRGKPTIAELYQLDEDIAEERDLASDVPERVAAMAKRFRDLIDSGASRSGLDANNDAKVEFKSMQTERWAPPLERE